MTVKSTFFVYNVENNMQPLYFCTGSGIAKYEHMSKECPSRCNIIDSRYCDCMKNIETENHEFLHCKL